MKTYDDTIDITIDLTDEQKAIYRAWVRRLESGEFRQTKQTLSRNDFGGPTFCCLGVLGDQLKTEFPGFLDSLGATIEYDDTGRMAVVQGGWVASTALDPIAPALGLVPTDYFCEPVLGLRQSDLMAANDDGRDFRAIARAIRLALIGHVEDARIVLGPR